MKIAFDASDLVTNRADGTTRYTWELVRRLPALSAQNNWHFIAPGHQPAELPLPANSSWHASPWPKYWTQSRLPADLFQIKPDVLFMPIQQLPLIRSGKLKTIAVIHDLAFHKFGSHYTYKDWLLLHIFSAQVAREADHVIAVSQATANDIAHFYGRTHNVHVIHHGVNADQFYSPSEEQKREGWQKLAKHYPNIKQPYILYVGQIQPRKNLVRLVKAFEQLQAADPSLQLVLAGGHGWLQQEILACVKKSPARQSIILPGRVPDELLPTLYANAEVFTLVSLYEGFGITVLEAMACGCPAVTSNVSSMPEFASKAGILVDPNNVNSIADGIRQARKKRLELKEKGIARARQFTWDKTTQQTMTVIEKAL